MDWLSLIIVILIVAIILDGVRRARNSRRQKVHLSKNARKADQLLDSEHKSDLGSEFPKGGARRIDSSYSSDSDHGVDATPRQTHLDLDDAVPMLMESVEDASDPEHHFEPSIGNVEELEHDAPERDIFENKASEPHQSDAELQTRPSPLSETLSETKSKLQKAAEYFNFEHSASDESDERLKNKEPAPVEEFIVINVMSRHGEMFAGEDILNVFSHLKLKFGERGIFHRHIDDDGDSDSIFSIANIVEPGVFDLSTINGIETPGLCMFLPLPNVVGGIEAYENLIETARNIAQLMHGELKDENRSALTNQTIEHGRQRVIEFERKHKLPK